MEQVHCGICEIGLYDNTRVVTIRNIKQENDVQFEIIFPNKYHFIISFLTARPLNEWNHPNNATVLPHYWWNFFSISVEAHWQYKTDHSRPSVLSNPDQPFHQECWFPQLSQGSVSYLYWSHSELSSRCMQIAILNESENQCLVWNYWN